RLPDKAIDLIDEACSKKKIGFKKHSSVIVKLNKDYENAVANRDYSLHHGDLDGAKFYDKKTKSLENKIKEEKAKISRIKEQTENILTKEDIFSLFAEITDIPLGKIDENELIKVSQIEDELYKRVIGQNHAIEVVSKALKRSLTGLKDPDRPIGVFLFVGPTGVGKSQLAKAINEVAFNGNDTLIRFDMSEYSDKTSINKLIGTAPGYVGFEEEGLLTEKVRRKPYNVILFDEIEKACPEIFDLLLQVIDEGRLTDSKGRLIDFKNTIIILTSNAGYQVNDKKFVGFGENNQENFVKENLKTIFRLEFLNRLDDIIVFRSLSLSDCYDIADVLVNLLIKRIREDGYLLTIDNSCMDIIVNNAYKNGGARQIKREIASKIEDLLTDAIIDGKIKIGDKIVVYGENNVVKYKVN
ncbi:MAG: ATP-dependent Clp protease ATP-binding subunit, partial [Clostridia bacterium]|nr:ATP-dependent Clp protease ATP-binding subunit [Clostridia bacterium]